MFTLSCLYTDLAEQQRHGIAASVMDEQLGQQQCVRDDQQHQLAYVGAQ